MNMYVAVAICTADSYVQMLTKWRRAFGKAEAIFVVDKSDTVLKGMFNIHFSEFTNVSCTCADSYLIPCVSVIVVGFFTPRMV